MRIKCHPPRCSHALNQSPLDDAVSIKGEHLGVGSNVWKQKSPYIPSVPVTHLGEFVLFILTSVITGLKFLVPTGETFLPGNTARVFSELKAIPPPSILGPSGPIPAAKQKVLMGVVDSCYQEAVELRLHGGDRETYVWCPSNN